MRPSSSGGCGKGKRLAFREAALESFGHSGENRAVLERLDHQQRLQLMKFVCAFAWADLSVHPEERAYVERLVARLGFEPDEERQIRLWLISPPPEESVDPTTIPREHGRIFLAAVDGVVAADGVISPEERESVRLLKELLL
jgi:uncharacterized tellurite resistance protein B-like protein